MTKPVQLSDEAYARLAAEKRSGESFSDVVLRLTRKPSLATLLNLRLSPAEKREMAARRRELEAIHELDRLDMERTLRRRGTWSSSTRTS